MKLIYLFIAFCLLSTNKVLANKECTEIYRLTTKYANEYNEVTQKAIELQEYNNELSSKKYYPFPLTHKQSQQYLKELLNKTPIKKIDPSILIYAISSCDFENSNIYLDHGLSLDCYTQEGGGNILDFLAHCRHHGEAERNQLLERLLQVGAKPNEGNKNLERDAAGIYPLSYATQFCDASMVDILLKYGADPNLKTTGENYFPILNICGGGRGYSQVGTPSELEYPKTPIQPLGAILQSFLTHGADPNTIYITNDQRNFATQDREKVLQLACSGQDPRAKSLYDLYAQEVETAKTSEDPILRDNYQKLFAVLTASKAKPLAELCRMAK